MLRVLKALGSAVVFAALIVEIFAICGVIG